MKNFVLGLLIIFSIGTVNSFAQEGASNAEKLVWYSDLMQANEISKSTKKPIFAFFTGSDWCGWCHKLQRDVFEKPEFIEWASKNVVLLELDFPRNKQLPQEVIQQNYGLQQAFNVAGYPTIWMFFLAKDDATQKFNIAALGSLGYPQQAQVGREEVKFLQDANRVLANTVPVNQP